MLGSKGNQRKSEETHNFVSKLILTLRTTFRGSGEENKHHKSLDNFKSMLAMLWFKGNEQKLKEKHTFLPLSAAFPEQRRTDGQQRRLGSFQLIAAVKRGVPGAAPHKRTAEKARALQIDAGNALVQGKRAEIERPLSAAFPGQRRENEQQGGLEKSKPTPGQPLIATFPGQRRGNEQHGGGREVKYDAGLVVERDILGTTPEDPREGTVGGALNEAGRVSVQGKTAESE
ncbi:hypothetical protein R3P38DRAFT_2761512 [Favolaschia claudopus]|uniref:Uncharacterized protein n=1 Tax=Favolaschia claudopus TaxID=2862362 RepID=A0AAW0DRS3_9AGAR